MKLPEDKNERKKIFMLIAIGVAVVGYGSFTFGINPLLKKQKNVKNQISVLEDKLWKARLDIDKIPMYYQQNSEVINKIVDVSENKMQILHPNLGNYLLVASDIVHNHAKNHNLVVNSIKEVNPAIIFDNNLDNKRDPNAPRFRPYTVNVNMKCGLYELTKLIHDIEKENPYLCITRLGVIGQPDNIIKHSVSFDIQWPIWYNTKDPIRLIAEQIIAKNRE